MYHIHSSALPPTPNAKPQTPYSICEQGLRIKAGMVRRGEMQIDVNTGQERCFPLPDSSRNPAIWTPITLA